MSSSASLKASQRKKSSLNRLNNKSPKKQAEFLVQKENMKGEYLSDCLDSCRWGSQTTVLYDMSIKQMISFIQKWMQQNKHNFQNLFNERKIEEAYTKFELPYINYELCPRNKEHEGVIKDLTGRLRCAHKSQQKFKPNFVRHWDFFDKLSGMTRREYSEDEPSNPFPDDAWNEETDELWKEEYKRYQEELEQLKKKNQHLL